MKSFTIYKKVLIGISSILLVSTAVLLANIYFIQKHLDALPEYTQWLSVSITIVNGIIVMWLLNKSINSSLAHITEKLSLSSNNLKGESESVNSSSALLSEASTSQASSLQETVSAIDEISSMVQRNADSAHSAAQVSVKSTEAALRGKKTVKYMIESIDEISSSNDDIMNEVNESNSEISKIATMISEIGDKTKIINDIVFQTKLLSFNASVEAARAGEHGKGFAVVAEEVGNLAAVSGKAALEITEMLDRSIEQVTSIVNNTKAKVDKLIQSGKKKVEVGAKTAEECGQALDEISNNVSSVNEMIKEISTASSEQATGVREVTKAIQELDRSTHQNSTIANDTLNVAKNLQEHSLALNSSIEELAIITGQSLGSVSVKPVKQESKRSDQTNNIINMTSHQKRKKQQQPAVQKSKQVVGLDVEVPSSDDPRFVDL